MIGKSELEIQIEKEEEKGAFDFNEVVLEKIEEMRFIFPFLS